MIYSNNEINIKYDEKIYIAYARSRKEKKYINKCISWSSLLKKLSKPYISDETVEEFKSYNKSKQDELKDVGGFVGGFLKDGKRKKGTIQYRSIVTLDIDFGDSRFLEKLKSLDYAYCVYSTRKHKMKNERYRLVIPLNRAVSSDEYLLICENISKKLGIDYFDTSSFQPERLMYFPSKCKDGDFTFLYNDEKWLNPDSMDLSNSAFSFEVLECKDNFNDKDNNTDNNNEDKVLSTDNRKALKSYSTKSSLDVCDPTKKTGVVGAFCRVFNVVQAIDEIISGVYIKGKINNRYTYFNSTTANGFLVNDNKNYGYSFHNSDPAGNKLCNSFDLVRIHKFLVNNTTEKESYRKMIEFAMSFPKVREELNKDNLEIAAKEFEKIKLSNNTNRLREDNKDNNTENIEIIEEKDMSWIKELTIDNFGKYSSSLKNIKCILENDENLKEKIGYNEFSSCTSIRDNLPWHNIKNKEEGDMWKDSDDAFLRLYLETVYEISAPNKIYDGIAVIEQENKYHPIREYLSSIEWDGVERLDSLFIDYFGAEDSSYVREATRKSLVAAVARVFEPGIKFDYMLVLVGEQGIGKSEIIKRLGRSWYSDSLTVVQGKESYEQLQGAWIIEMAELAAIKKSEAEIVKHFISKQEDIFRAAYGKRTIKYPRQCVFFGTTNDVEFLRDRTGNRRFWPIALGRNIKSKDIWRDFSDEVINQIWAEAAFRYNEGESLYLKADNETFAVEAQKEHLISDFKEGMIKEFLERPISRNWDKMSMEEKQYFISNVDFDIEDTNLIYRDKVCALEVWVELFKGDMKFFTLRLAKEINDILSRTEGWTKYNKGCGRLRFGKEYGSQKAFVRESYIE